MLAREFAADDVVVLGRALADVRWDGRTLGPWTSALEGADALINLAGRTVDCRYTAANRHEIMDSRLASTRVLRDAIERAADPPKVWLQSSTATIYATHVRPRPRRVDRRARRHRAELPDTWRFSVDVARAVGGGGAAGARRAAPVRARCSCARRWS